MKKILILLTIGALTFTSCSKEDLKEKTAVDQFQQRADELIKQKLEKINYSDIGRYNEEDVVVTMCENTEQEGGYTNGYKIHYVYHTESDSYSFFKWTGNWGTYNWEEIGVHEAYLTCNGL